MDVEYIYFPSTLFYLNAVCSPWFFGLVVIYRFVSVVSMLPKVRRSLLLLMNLSCLYFFYFLVKCPSGSFLICVDISFVFYIFEAVLKLKLFVLMFL